MKKHIALAAALLLTLSTAVAGTLIYSHDQSDQFEPAASDTGMRQELTPETIAMWKATSASGDYIAPKVPI